LLVVACLTGAALRWYQLRIQVVLDDEWHALHKLLQSDSWDILTSFGYADHSIPLTLYYRFLLLHGGLTEWVMHLPMLLSGVALLLIAPWLMRRECTLAVRAVWAVMLAISPLLVYHSKTARPYALTSLLTLVALVAFRRWWLGGRSTRAWAGTYIITTVLAGYLHPITLPFTLLPFIYYGVQALLSYEEDGVKRRLMVRRLLVLGIGTPLLLACALLPPVVNDWTRLSAKAGAHSVTPESLYRTLLMLFGIAHPALLAILLIITALGLYRSSHRHRDFVGYVAVVALGSLAAIAAARPLWIHHPLVLARYVQPALPFLLLFLAEGCVACLERLQAGTIRAGIVAALAGLLWWSGPMPDYLYYPNQFIGHLRFQYDYDPAHNPYVLEVPRDPMPDFYRRLAEKRPRSLTLIEAPWRLESNFNPHPWYQEVHRQFVKIGLVTPVCGVRDFGEYPATVTALRLS